MNCGRKRTHSLTTLDSTTKTGGPTTATNIPSRRKKTKWSSFAAPGSKRRIIPPTKFLLGGNIRDPLNLSGLQNEDSSDGGTDVSDESLSCSFLLGGDIHDPLNLKHIHDDVIGEQTSSSEGHHPVSKIPDIKLSKDVDDNNAATILSDEKNCSTESKNCSTGSGTDAGSCLTVHPHPNVAQCKRKDKIVSPVIPQPYRPVKNLHFKHQIITPNLNSKEKTPKFNEKNSRFQYGNYNRYYGYRNTHNGPDLRLEILSNHKGYFVGNDILDIGCNIGHISMIIARDFNSRSVTGIDIDRSLINIAKKNVKHYINCTSPFSHEATPHPAAAKEEMTDVAEEMIGVVGRGTLSSKRMDMKNKCYPVSMPILYGPVCDEYFHKKGAFPKNVNFQHGNYVLDSDNLLQLEKPQFDTILCLSTTKWLHLNFGDAGLKRAFKRMFLQLRPGGALIIEPQSWDSYTKKKSLTEIIWKNYQHIQLFPHHFDRYLLSQEVGFSRCQTLALVNHQQKGFRRPLKVFIKPLSNFVGECSEKEIATDSLSKDTVDETSKNLTEISTSSSSSGLEFVDKILQE